MEENEFVSESVVEEEDVVESQGETAFDEVFDVEEADELTVAEQEISEEVKDEPDTTQNSDEDAPVESIESLREEIVNLKRLIAEREKERDRMMEQLGEFSEVYPEMTLESIPTEVWNSVRGGVPLAAAYALYEKKTSVHTEFAEKVNSRNAERSSGAVGRECDCLYYSPDEVRQMSSKEVKQKYNIIIESMKKWN